MKLSIYLIILIITVLGLSSCTKSPDTIFVNGKVYSLDNNNTQYEAIAVKDGKIFELGKTEDFKSKYSKAKLVDLQGKTVIPGLIDCEANLALFSRYLSYIQIEKFTNREDIKTKVKEKVSKFKEGTWVGVFFYGGNMAIGDSLLELDKRFLDEISTNHNIFIYFENNGDRIALCNSKMLNTLRITPKTESPEYGEIGLDENDELDGFLYDDAAALIDENYRTISKEEMLSSVELATNELLKYGITEIHDRYVNRENLSIYRQLIDSNKFAIKLYAILSVIKNDDTYKEFLTKGPENDYKGKLSIRGLTIDYDGMFERQIAVMKDEYLQEPKRQVPFSSEEEIEDAIKSANDKKFQIRIKAVGDKAVNSALNSFERVNANKELRPMIEHCEFITQPDIQRMKTLGIMASIRPEYCVKDMEILSKLIKKENSINLGLWKSLLQNTGKIVTGSDFPFKNPNPFVQLYYLINKKALSDSLSVSSTPEKLTIEEALRAYTIWAAYTSFDEDLRGSLEKDKLADFVVISEDIFKINPQKLPDIKVLKTVIAGNILFELK